MKIYTLFNIIYFLKNFNRFILLIKKVIRRVIKTNGSISYKDNLKFLNKNCEDLDMFFSNIDSNLWTKSKLFQNTLYNYANQKLKSVKHDLGGGGAYNVIYFLTKLVKPKIIFETGVGAGYSTYAFLTAIKENNLGSLFSSDFPYFRLKKPERYIGFLVTEDLKDNWILYDEGDEKNIKDYIHKYNYQFDILHYDSDKTYLGRTIFFKNAKKQINKNTIILMDDIQDNSFFYDYINKEGIKKWKIFKFENKFIGLIYNKDFF